MSFQYMHMIDNKREIALTFIHDLFPMGKQVRKIKKKKLISKRFLIQTKNQSSPKMAKAFFYLDRGYKKMKPVSQKVN